MTIIRPLISIGILALAGQPALAADPSHCATSAQSAAVVKYFTETRPGAPLPIPGRVLAVKEAIVASGLPRTQSWGIASTPDIFRRIWRSIDAWGARTQVALVFTGGGSHAWNFPSLVPITQPDRANGMYDMNADDGHGVHGHITMADVASAWAVELPRKDGPTRAIVFYDKRGELILGVYASIAGAGPEKNDDKAIPGFEKTRDLIRSLPGICLK
jgi:putative heme iron utilization protein